jgi:AcrR family transcriptional regulator
LTKTRDESQQGRDPDARKRRILEVAALEASGEAGYQSLTTEAIVARAGLDSESFHRHFAAPSACYASAYAVTVDELVAGLVGSTRSEMSWVEGMRAALERVGRFLEAEPLLARGILLEVYAAGGAAVVKHDEVFERLSRAIDTARRETEPRHSPPPIAATLILSMIEAAASRWLRDEEPDSFTEAIPDLLYLAVFFYFGREEAERQIG